MEMKIQLSKWKTAKAGPKGKLIMTHAYLKKLEKS